MYELPFLKDIIVIFGIAIGVVFLFRKLRQSPIIGYILTGAIVGPYGLSLIDNPSQVDQLADAGVVLLLFTIGLEFSPSKLSRNRGTILGIGGSQVIATWLAAAFVARSFGGIEVSSSVLVGFALALSSTAIVLKLLAERGEVDSAHGRISIGILLLQDLCVVLMMVALPMLAASGAFTTGLLLAALLKAALVISLIFFFSRYILCAFLHQMVKLRSRELFIITSLFICLGTAWMTASFGLSLALGAFIAGLILSESEYGQQIFSDILPFRDCFISLFFISIGMLVEPDYLYQNIVRLLEMTALVLAGKALIAGLAIVAAGFPLRVAIIAGLAVAQVGEFSFILMREGLNLGVIGPGLYQLLLTSIVLTMALAPLVIKLSPSVAYGAERLNFAARLFPDRRLGKIAEEASPLSGHAIICGYGIAGQNLARILRQNSIPYIVLELNSQTVREAKRQGESIAYGDATSEEILKGARIAAARALVIAINDPIAVARATSAARRLNPKLFIMARTKYLSEIDELFDAGADEVVPEEFEVSIELLARILRLFGVPAKKIADQVRQIRSERYEMFRELYLPPQKLADIIMSLPPGEVEATEMNEGSPHVGKTIGEFGLRSRCGATIIGVKRDGSVFSNPSSAFRVDKGDVLTLFGDKDSVERALKLLSPDRGQGD